jgi:hypothetical protein
MISNSYNNMSPSELEAFSATIINRLQTNPLFVPIRDAALINLLLAHAAFSAAKLDYETYRGTDRGALRESCRLALVKELFLTSVIVLAFAKDNMDIVKAAGYAPYKTSRPKNSDKKEPVPVTAPTNFNIVHVANKPGFLYLKWTGVKGARIYGIFKRLVGTTDWINGTQTSNKYIELSGFEPGSVWEFCICTYGAGEFKSEPTSAFGILIK